MSVTGWSSDGTGADIVLTGGRLRLSSPHPRVIRVLQTARDQIVDRPGPAMLPRSARAPRMTASPGRLTASTDLLSLEIDTATEAFTWRTPSGDLLFREPRDGAATRLLEPVEVIRTDWSDAVRTEQRSVDGLRSSVTGGRPIVDRTAYATTLRLEFCADEVVYGLGQHEEGLLDHRGATVELYQQNMKVAVPVLLSSRGYAVMWDSGSAARFQDGPDGASLRTDVEDELDVHVVVGPEFDDIVAALRDLTGRVPMLPRWALGYVQSKERYTGSRELLDVVGEFRRRHIPLDCIVQDWQSWPGELWGQKEFDPARYPDPGLLCDRLHEAGVRLMVSIWPNMHHDGPDQLAMRERGFLLGDDSTYDAGDPAARRLYWEQTEHGYFRHGVDAWWADCTEPFEADWRGAVKPDPAARREINLGEATRFLDPEQVNSYSFDHTRGLWEGQRAAAPDRRVVVLTRSASLGQQRYGALTWSGDISASWATLRSQIADGLSFCLTGNPRWTFDIGAFFVGREDGLWFRDGDFDGGVDDAGYRELYLRWLQVGAFLPMMRSHGTETPREPWRFGSPGDPVYDAIVAFIGLRYRLLPYLYSLHAWESLRAYTSMRALAFDFRADPAALRVADQFMLGPALLVCPVTEPMAFGPGSAPLVGVPHTRPVHLPAGADWYDFWTGRRHRGGGDIQADAPLDRIPLFVRAGTVLPLGPVVEHTGAAPGAPVELRVYPGADSSFDLHDDAGDGWGYEDGEQVVTTLRWDDAAGTLAVGPPRGDHPGWTGPPQFAAVTVGPGGPDRPARGVGIAATPPEAMTPCPADGSAIPPGSAPGAG